MNDQASRQSWSYREGMGQPLDHCPRWNPRVVSASANVNPLDDLTLVSGNTTMTLETAVACDGRRHTFIKTDSSATTMTLATTGGQTINGASTITATVQYSSFVVISDGTNWKVISGAVSATGTPAPPDTSVQFNNGGVFGGSANLVFVSPTTTAHTLTVSTGLLTVTPGNITTGAATDMNFQTSGGTQLRAMHVASAANFAQFRGGVTSGSNGSGELDWTGGATNVTGSYTTKGNGTHDFYTNMPSPVLQFQVTHTASASNNLTATGSNASQPKLEAVGSSVTIGMALVTKAAGVFSFCGRAQATNEDFRVTTSGSTPGHYINVTSNVSNFASVSAIGSAAPCNLRLSNLPNSAAGGYVEMSATTSTPPAFRAYTTNAGTATAPNNYLAVQSSGGAGDQPVILQLEGTGGSNISMTLKPKGTGSIITEPGSGTTMTLVSTSGTTASLWDTVSTTVNFAGAATTLNMGAATGTATINNATVAHPNATAFTVGTDPGGTGVVRIGGTLVVSSTILLRTKTSFTDGAGVATGTLTTAPTAGNPSKWIGVDDNGTTRYIPAW